MPSTRGSISQSVRISSALRVSVGLVAGAFFGWRYDTLVGIYERLLTARKLQRRPFQAQYAVLHEAPQRLIPRGHRNTATPANPQRLDLEVAVGARHPDHAYR